MTVSRAIVGLWVVTLTAGVWPSVSSAQELMPLARAQALAAEGRRDDAWRLIEPLPVSPEVLALGVQLALAPKAPTVDAARLSWLADRGARVVLAESAALRVEACAIVTRLTGDAECAKTVMDLTRGVAGTVLDGARVWVALRRLGQTPPPLPNGWEGGVLGSTALELAAWPELPAASRVRLLEPLVTSQDPGVLIAALTTLQLVPGPEAEAVWRRLAAAPVPAVPGVRTLITVGLARVGDAESLKTLAPHEGSLSSSDRLALAMGRAERGDRAGRAALATMVNAGDELTALRAAEALAGLGGDPVVHTRVRQLVRAGDPPLRWRWLGVAGRLGLGDSAEVVFHLNDRDPEVRLAASLAVTLAAIRTPR